MNIPLVDIKAQQAEIAAEVEPVVLNILRSGGFIGGPEVARFEQRYAEFIDVNHCVGVANGTDAVELALRAVGVSAGGEVIMPANTFIATAEAASRIGARPVPVDVDPDYLLIDPDAVADAITTRTQAIVPVHLFGQVAPVERLEPIANRAGVPIIEDAAQAQGARRFGRPAGGLGRIAGTSFYPGKNLGAGGDAGAVTTNDAGLARTVRLLGAHGSAVKYRHDIVGMNSRLDAIHAAVLNAKLSRLENWNAARRRAADRYAELLADLADVRLPHSMPGNSDVWHLYVIRLAERDRVLAELNAAGIGAGLHYPQPWHRTDAYADLGYPEGMCPVAEAAAREILSLPIYPHLADGDQHDVARALARAMGTALPQASEARRLASSEVG